MNAPDVDFIHREIELMDLWPDKRFLSCQLCKQHVIKIYEFLKDGNAFAAAFEYGLGWGTHFQQNHPVSATRIRENTSIGNGGGDGAYASHFTYTDGDDEDVPVEEL